MLYNRGLINSMIGVEAIRTAQKKFGNKPMTGEQVRWGFENLELTAARIKELGFEGMMQPMKFSCADHAGRRSARVHQWDGKDWKIISDWYTADRSILDPMVKDTAAKYAAEKKITPRDCSKVELSATRVQLGSRQCGAARPAAASYSALHQRPRAPMSTAAARRTAASAAAKPILSVNNIEVIYDHVILVLKGVSLDGAARAASSRILGANGAGKSTTLKSISNLHQGRARRGHQGLDRVQGRARRRADAERSRPARLHPGDGGPPLLRPSHRSRRTC